MKRKQQPEAVKSVYDRIRRLHTITNATDRARAASEVVRDTRAACEQMPNDSEMYAALRAAWAARHDAEQAAELAANFSMCYQTGFWPAYARFRQGQADELEAMTAFLEADAWAFRSGYTKAKIIRALKPSLLTPAYVMRLQQVVLHVVDTRDDRDFRAFCRLARKADGPELREALKARLASLKPEIRRRAQWVLDALAQKDQQEKGKPWNPRH